MGNCTGKVSLRKQRQGEKSEPEGTLTALNLPLFGSVSDAILLQRNGVDGLDECLWDSAMPENYWPAVMQPLH